MQDNTTTIQIRLDQRDALQDRKQHDRESYKAVLDRLLAESDAQDDSAETWTDDDVERVRSMLETVESRTGSMERTLENLQR